MGNHCSGSSVSEVSLCGEIEHAHMVLGEFLLPRPHVPCFAAVVRNAGAGSGHDELADLQLGVRDDAPRHARIRSAVQAAVEDVLAPARG